MQVRLTNSNNNTMKGVPTNISMINFMYFLKKNLTEDQTEQLRCNVSEFSEGSSALDIKNEACSKWIYDKSFYQETVGTQVRVQPYSTMRYFFKSRII